MISNIFFLAVIRGGGRGNSQEFVGQHGALVAAGRLPPRHDQ